MALNFLIVLKNPQQIEIKTASKRAIQKAAKLKKVKLKNQINKK